MLRVAIVTVMSVDLVDERLIAVLVARVTLLLLAALATLVFVAMVVGDEVSGAITTTSSFIPPSQ